MPSTQPLLVLRTSARSKPLLLLLPIPIVFLTEWLLWKAYADWFPTWFETEHTLPWYAYALVALFAALFPLWAKVSTWLGSRYTVTLESVTEERGLLSRTSSEVRIRDIRNMVVQQTAMNRLLGIGSVAFSSAAGDKAEVTFRDVPRPHAVRDLVRGIQDRLADGVLSDAERHEVHAGMGRAGRLAAAPPAPAAANGAPEPHGLPLDDTLEHDDGRSPR